jgi:CelD/BcsL family acetyltransferase involved in cellulose biosynthesis
MLELIPSLAELEKLRPQWDELHDRCDSATPFQAAAWLLPWARHFAPDRLMAIAVCERDALSALLPFFSWDNRMLLAGSGPTDYCDGLFAGKLAHVDEMIAALAGYAAEVGCGCIDLQQLPPRSALLTATAPRGWTSQIDDGTPCPVTALAGDDALAPVSPRWRKNIGKARRKLEKQAHFELRCVREQLFDGAAAEVIRLHCARWRQRHQDGVLSGGLMQSFLVSALPELSASGLLRLHTLHVSDRLIAVLLGVHSKQMTCFYIGGFDPEWATYSPGSILLEAAIEQAAKEGAREFHFLRGCESYKYHFGARDTPTFRRILTRVPTS